ncbi:MAG: hypothetical protein CMN30_21320 [Sandaracinus sp.]|nr:hypothetical protein [Sandaracinus sp.]|tara:strand:+ start:2732 stop:3127 length:396 start_codon:yes stop_codon:yes gene_type:complete
MSTRVRGRYELQEEIGRGGMGTVFAGRDVLDDRVCAIKVIREDALFDPDARERFEREARAPQQIDHPGIAQVYDAFIDDDGRMVLVMELLHGESLRDLMGAGTSLQHRLAVVVGALEGPRRSTPPGTSIAT